MTCRLYLFRLYRGGKGLRLHRSSQPHSLQTFAAFCVDSGVQWQPDFSVYAIIPKAIGFYQPDVELKRPVCEPVMNTT
jgi:hypothetical protein